MPFGSVIDPTPGTVITVSAHVATALNPIRWLRLLTGNADPPGSNYVVVSTGTAGTSWQKIPADAIIDGAITESKIAIGAISALKLAAGAVVAHLGYTPVNHAGDSGLGPLSTTGIAAPGTNFVGMQIVNAYASAGVISALYKAQCGASNASSFGYIRGLAEFAVVDGNGVVVTHFDSATQRWKVGSSYVWDESTLNPAALTVGNTSLLNGQPGSAYLSRINHTDTQLAATISNFAATVATLTAASAGTATTAATANAVAALSVTDAGIAAANKDGAAGTVGMRSLGAGAQQAAAGNHAHALMGQLNSGTYSGNNGTATINTTLTPKRFWLSNDNGTVYWDVFAGKAYRHTIGGASAVDTNVAIVAGGVSVSGTGGSYSLGNNYTWVAVA